MRRWSRVAAAVAVSTGSALLAPQAAFACSGPALTLDEATTTATLILAGRVSSNPHEWAYELEVEEVFRGPRSDTVLIGPIEPATPPICSHQLEVGERVVVALRDPSDLGLFSSAVWYLLPDGSVGTVAPEPPAATHDELFASLRLLPDTAIASVPQPAIPLRPVGVILLAAGVALGIARPAIRHGIGSAIPGGTRRRGEPIP